MNGISMCFETAATIMESTIVLLSVKQMVGENRKHKFILLLGIVLLSSLVTLFNLWETFSFVTPLVSMLFVVAFSKVSWRGSILKIATATVLAYLVMNTIDYTTFFTISFIVHNPISNSNSFFFLMTPGPVRYFCLMVDKGSQIILYLVLQKTMPGFRELKRRYLFVVTGISVVAYYAMSSLVSMILSDSIVITQAGILLSWVFGCLCVIVSLIALIFFGRYQSESEFNHLLSMSNSMMEKNYEAIHQNQATLSKLNHDFMNHLRLIHSYAEQHDDQRIIEYTNDLLREVFDYSAVCKSGNDAVDAVINTKFKEAEENSIPFSWEVNLSNHLPIQAIDVCAILANQIDNAFEACRRIPASENRSVEVHIWNPTESVVLFQVKNTTLGNPLENNENLHTTKTDKSRQHGIGLRSIRNAAERYEGTLENTYQNGFFISTVSLLCQFNENETLK